MSLVLCAIAIVLNSYSETKDVPGPSGLNLNLSLFDVTLRTSRENIDGIRTILK